MNETTTVTPATKKLSQILLHFRMHRGGVLKNNGGYTVLVKKHLVGTTELFKVAAARCGKSDGFNKAIGRAIVEGRMECTKSKHIPVWIADKQFVLDQLDEMNRHCKEKYDRNFFDRLLSKLG